MKRSGGEREIGGRNTLGKEIKIKPTKGTTGLEHKIEQNQYANWLEKGKQTRQKMN